VTWTPNFVDISIDGQDISYVSKVKNKTKQKPQTTHGKEHPIKGKKCLEERHNNSKPGRVWD